MTAIATAPPPSTATPQFATDPGSTSADGDELYELVYGRVVEKRMGFDANWTAGRITGFITIHLLQTGAGDVLPEQSFQCFPDDPDGFRRPDVAFIAAGRVPTPPPAGHMPIRPDLAVEVVSPTDNAYDLQDKLDDYRSVGIPLVWVVWPHVRLVQLLVPGQPIVELRPGDTLTGGDVLPGFAVAVAELFRPAAAAQPTG